MSEDPRTMPEPASTPISTPPPTPTPTSTPAPTPTSTPEPNGRTADRAGQEPGELVLSMSPRQIIGGFALLAGLILMLRRRARRKG